MTLPAESLLVGWEANTESDLAGYTVHYGYESGSYSSSIDVGKVTSYTIEDVSQGMTYYIALTAYDTSGNTSEYSDELSATIPATSDTESTDSTTVTQDPDVTLVSPTNGAVVSAIPELAWSAISVTTSSVYMAVNNLRYYRMYSGSGTSFRLPSYLWYWFVPTGATIRWYVVGNGTDGEQIRSAAYAFTKG
jgi:hypothetical protein